jgi:hypothetical protein
MSKNLGLARAATRNVNRAEVVDRNFLEFLDEWDHAADGSLTGNDAVRPGDGSLTVAEFSELFESQMASRHIDLEARAMRIRNEGFYTIGSSGHECNTVLGRLTRETDPAFLHYRSGGFMMERLKKVGQDPVYDTALSLSALPSFGVSRAGIRTLNVSSWSFLILGIRCKMSASSSSSSRSSSGLNARSTNQGAGPYPFLTCPSFSYRAFVGDLLHGTSAPLKAICGSTVPGALAPLVGETEWTASAGRLNLEGI